MRVRVYEYEKCSDLKRPFVLLKDRGLVGFKEDEWKAAFRS